MFICLEFTIGMIVVRNSGIIYCQLKIWILVDKKGSCLLEAIYICLDRSSGKRRVVWNDE